MRPSHPWPTGLIVSLLLVAVPVAGHAERLFVGLGESPSPDGRIARLRTLALDAGALASLRARTAATLTEFPLGADGEATLAVERFAPFASDTRVELVAPGGVEVLALPDQLYYRGKVAGDDGSRVLVIAGPGSVHGLVATAGAIYRFGKDRSGVYRSWALRDADPAAFPPPATVCANDLYQDTVNGHGGRTAVSPGVSALPPPALGYSPTLLAEVAIETDQEFLAYFSDTDEALAYLAELAAAVSSIYDADVDVRVVFRFIRLWSVPDPWTATTTLDALLEVQDYWTLNEGATPRDVVHFLTGKDVGGGIAYLDVLCDPDFGYGVSGVYGEFDLLDPSDTWDVVVVAHELGHNFGSVHTHCYMPPLDMCYGGESGCYSGPTSVPPGGGTIMSYCHLKGGGLSNINLTFGATVSDVLRTGAENGICIGPPCGDGILDAGEDCDDGNVTDGDCCSSTCTAEPDGGACDDGEPCTEGDQCASGACAGTPVTDGTPCDDGSACTDDSCQSGSCVGVAALAPGCKEPTLALKSQIVIKDKSPDKGDQVVWKWTKGADTAFPEFGTPNVADDYELCVYEPGPSVLFKGRIPGGGTCRGLACWKVISTKGYSYKDKDRTPDGMEKLSLKAGTSGAAKISAKGKGELLDMPSLGSVALPVVVQLKGPGTCWEATFSTPILDTTEQFKAKSDAP